MPSVAELLERESATVDLELGDFERLLRRRDRKRRNQRLAAGGLALVMSLFLVAILVRVLQSGTVPADRPVEPSPSTERVGFVGLPPEGVQPTTRSGGGLVISSNGFGPVGVRVDLYVYADGTMIWQKWSVRSSVPVGVPEGANELITGYLEQRLTPDGVELLRSSILSTGLFEHNLRLRAGSLHPALTIGVQDGERVVVVSAFKTPDNKADIAKETPAQTRAIVELESLLADPAAWLPPTAWADREIRAFVPSEYSEVFDRRAPSPSELPPPADELLFDNCNVLTLEQAHEISRALEDAGITGSISSDGELAYSIGPASYPAYLHFWPVLPQQRSFPGWQRDWRGTC